MERSLVTSGRLSRIGILQDENDEFINFSDDENVVTLPLDAISLSSRNSSRNCDELTTDMATVERDCTLVSERRQSDYSFDNSIGDKAELSESAKGKLHENNNTDTHDAKNNDDIDTTDIENDKATPDDLNCNSTDASNINGDHDTKHPSYDTQSESSDRGDDYSDDLVSYESEDDIGIDSERSEPSPTPTETVRLESGDTDTPDHSPDMPQNVIDILDHTTDQSDHIPDKPEHIPDIPDQIPDTLVFIPDIQDHVPDALLESDDSQSGQLEVTPMPVISAIQEDSSDSEHEPPCIADVVAQPDVLDVNVYTDKDDYVDSKSTPPITVEITPKLEQISSNHAPKHNTSDKVQTSVSSRSDKQSDRHSAHNSSTTRHPQYISASKLYAQKPKPLPTYSAKHKQLIFKRDKLHKPSSEKVHHDSNITETETISESNTGHTTVEQNVPINTDGKQHIQHKHTKYDRQHLLAKRRSIKENKLKKIYHSQSNRHTRPTSDRNHERSDNRYCSQSAQYHTGCTKGDSEHHRASQVLSVDNNTDTHARQPGHIDKDRTMRASGVARAGGLSDGVMHITPSDKPLARATPVTSRKVTKPLNINDLHQEISAINAKAMADHKEHLKSNQIAVLHIETKHVKLNDGNAHITAPDENKRRAKSHNDVRNKQPVINKRVTYTRESLNKFASKHNENKLKIETETRHAQSLPKESTRSRDKESNYTAAITESSLLREDYTSGNWNINERYGNDPLSTENNKPRSSYSNTDLPPSDEINIITEQENDAPAQETGITVQPRPYKLAPLPVRVEISSKHDRHKLKTKRSVKRGKHGDINVSEAM